MRVVNLESCFTRFSELWSPKIVGELNGQYVKLAKLRGEFVWHAHDNEDELFLVVRGVLRIRLDDRELTVREGEFTIIPRAVKHMPVAEQEVHVILFEPRSTVSTGAELDERRTQGEWL